MAGVEKAGIRVAPSRAELSKGDKMKLILFFLVAFASYSHTSRADVWTKLNPQEANEAQAKLAGNPYLEAADQFCFYKLDSKLLAEELKKVPLRKTFEQSARVSIPMPDGKIKAYEAIETPIFETIEIQLRNIDMRTYTARTEYATLKFEFSHGKKFGAFGRDFSTGPLQAMFVEAFLNDTVYMSIVRENPLHARKIRCN
jgi:hypothetical protein